MVSWLGSTSAVQASAASSGSDFDLFAKCRVQQLRGFEHQRVDVDLARLQRLFARKCEQMPGQSGAAFRGFIDQLGDRHEFRPVGDGFGQYPDGAGDDGQNIVEVMSHAAGQLADRFHLLGLAELGFRGPLFA